MNYSPNFSRVLIAAAAVLYSGQSFSETLWYALNATLDDGGEVEGVFAIDTDTPDLESSTNRGEFELTHLSLILNSPGLLQSGGDPSTSGVATSGQLFQNGPANRQTLVFNFVSKEGAAGVFSDLRFGPFSEDPNTVSPLLANDYLGGYFDGNGQVNTTTFSLIEIPEPSSVSLMAAFMAGLLQRRRKA